MKLGNMKRGEDTEQIKVIRWAAAAECRHPELKWLHHIPNGGSRSSAEAVRLKQMGVRRGVSDLCLPHPCGRYHGLYIEMKHGRNVLTKEQAEFLCDMCDARYCVAVCYGSEAAIGLIEKYISLPDKGLLDPGEIKDTSFGWDENGICHIRPSRPPA